MVGHLNIVEECPSGFETNSNVNISLILSVMKCYFYYGDMKIVTNKIGNSNAECLNVSLKIRAAKLTNLSAQRSNARRAFLLRICEPEKRTKKKRSASRPPNKQRLKGRRNTTAAQKSGGRVAAPERDDWGRTEFMEAGCEKSFFAFAFPGGWKRFFRTNPGERDCDRMAASSAKRQTSTVGDAGKSYV
ncbi:uncharacterized protein TNCV_4701841 [Trichonephila clavipes]|uniref:Uncharacterized protein n=1 Tax=Trichonephila clavipes TaxID=2585209 RepID=A0A8X6WGM0_TRICX|nr:uncharacterized protein TNCV_4701841 [Trichonephila clavipes]